ncbi:hypothetical protein R5H32_11235 [Defluviimonas sp. D31]|uniref:hypothetical protein n=1 Tax=Defluviimonas sp. D31 TaxID=3083253 RepID=UPI00296FD184|nr:hypothetical protein [Defluviimonas sp. D31]MDW4549927.1 hypothetical protein [Defluviimonas sp. D31]
MKITLDRESLALQPTSVRGSAGVGHACTLLCFDRGVERLDTLGEDIAGKQGGCNGREELAVADGLSVIRG